MESFTPVVVALVAVFAYVTFWFFLSRILRRNDLADIAWGPGILLVGIVGYIYSGSELSLLVLGLMSVWGLRLGFRIGLRNLKKKEDARYIELAKSWGKWFLLRSYAQVFLLQGFLMVVVGYPALHLAMFGGDISTLAYVGVSIWALGFFFEAVGDYQLDAFLKNPENKGRIMKYGLWKYTRHPNYFGEVTQWWGIFLMIVSSSLGLVAIISPLMITFLILKVSGIPMTEKIFEGNVEFQEYKKKTSPFFPWFKT